MGKLSDKEYWDSIYKKELGQMGHPSKRKLKIVMKKLLGEKIFEYMTRNYSDYLLWDVIYKKYMPKTKGAKILEIGSAPGAHLIRLNQTFEFDPYGVEYSENGVELNRKLFILHNINPTNVIHADFFSDDFNKKYTGYFDIVTSYGFIEHFTNVEDVIGKHIDLLKNGGFLFIIIPNLKGVNYLLAKFFNNESISIHNVDIMEKKEFLKLFDKKPLSILFCDYYGTFNSGLFNTKRNSSMRIVLNFCYKFQLILNLAFRILFKDKGKESSLFSPYLIFVGVKNG